nr:MAG: nonstructural protein [Microvirus sp.]
MSKLQIFTIHDQPADAFIPPFFLPNENMAKRTFQQCIHDETHQFSKSPSDYTLFHLGEFDSETAEIIPTGSPITLGNGVVFLPHPDSKPQTTE